jgi:hypothetical protein
MIHRSLFLLCHNSFDTACPYPLPCKKTAISQRDMAESRSNHALAASKGGNEEG